MVATPAGHQQLIVLRVTVANMGAALHRGILEGRKAFGNVMKYLLMGTSSNFGNMFSMAAASVFLKFLPMLPPSCA